MQFIDTKRFLFGAEIPLWPRIFLLGRGYFFLARIFSSGAEIPGQMRMRQKFLPQELIGIGKRTYLSQSIYIYIYIYMCVCCCFPMHLSLYNYTYTRHTHTNCSPMFTLLQRFRPAGDPNHRAKRRDAATPHGRPRRSPSGWRPEWRRARHGNAFRRRTP